MAPNRNVGCFVEDDISSPEPASYRQDRDEFAKIFRSADSSTPLHKSSAPGKVRFARTNVGGKSFLSAYNHRGDLVTQLDVHKMLAAALKDRAESYVGA